MKAHHLVGLILWRGGLLLAGGWALYRGIRLALQYFELPTQIEVGVALILSGFGFVMLSLILEARHMRVDPGDER